MIQGRISWTSSSARLKNVHPGVFINSIEVSPIIYLVHFLLQES